MFGEGRGAEPRFAKIFVRKLFFLFLATKTEIKSSTDLLARIRQRKENCGEAPSSSSDEEEERRGLIKRASKVPATAAPNGVPNGESASNGALNGEISSSNLKHQELVEDLRAFVALNDGRVTTEEILLKFQSKIGRNFSAIFRSMLKKICEMQKMDGKVFWQLKLEFR